MSHPKNNPQPVEKPVHKPVDNSQGMRLQLLQMVHRPDKDAKTLIDRAKAFEQYILGITEGEGDNA